MRTNVLFTTSLLVGAASCVLLSCQTQNPESWKSSRTSVKSPNAGTEGSPVDDHTRLPGAQLPPEPQINFEPEDLTTSVGNSPLVVTVNSSLLPATEAMVDKVRSEVSLREWPSLAEIPFHTTIAIGESDFGPNGGKTAAISRITLVPDAGLSGEKWYIIRLKRVPAGYQLAKDARIKRLQGGGAGARIFKGSAPTLALATLCHKDDGKKVLNLQFSERVPVANTRDRSQLRIESASGDCLAAQVPSLGEGTTGSVQFQCPSADVVGPFALDIVVNGMNGSALLENKALESRNNIRIRMDERNTRENDSACRVLEL